MFVICGTGRSGTKWAATTLRINGVLCGHEQVFATGQLVRDFIPPNWGRFEGDSSLAAVPFLSKIDARRVLIVRDPSQTARSFVANGPFGEYAQPAGLMAYLTVEHPQIFTEESEFEKALRYWLIWNRMALESCDVWARLEDLTAESLLGLVGLESRWPGYPLGPVNMGAKHDEWEPVSEPLYSEVAELADVLGYT